MKDLSQILVTDKKFMLPSPKILKQITFYPNLLWRLDVFGSIKLILII